MAVPVLSSLFAEYFAETIKSESSVQSFQIRNLPGRGRSKKLLPCRSGDESPGLDGTIAAECYRRVLRPSERR